jgi:hypothetical protein
VREQIYPSGRVTPKGTMPMETEMIPGNRKKRSALPKRANKTKKKKKIDQLMQLEDCGNSPYGCQSWNRNQRSSRRPLTQLSPSWEVGLKLEKRDTNK